MLVEACLNGARTRADHPAVPTTPAALARDVAAAVAAGADALHVHVKDAGERDTLEPRSTEAVLRALSGCGVPVGVTTGAWAEPDVRRRAAAPREWTLRPDFASVNWHEDGAQEVAATLLEVGIGVEAGLWHEDALRAWLRCPTRDRHLRVLLELPGDLDETAVRRTADRMVGLLEGETDLPLLLHGEDASAWPALRHARSRGLDTRVGLEDTLVLPDGRPAPDNASLIRAVVG